MRVRVPDDVLVRSMGDEMVLLSLKNGHYFGLNASGARMFELLTEEGDVELVARRIAGEFDVGVDEATRDLKALCKQLAGQSLMLLVDDPD
jgi:hypothetical protein